MITEILISFGIAVGVVTSTIVVILVGILLITLAEKIADNMKNNMGYKKFNNIKRITIFGSAMFFFILIITYLVYVELFTH